MVFYIISLLPCIRQSVTNLKQQMNPILLKENFDITWGSMFACVLATILRKEL